MPTPTSITAPATATSVTDGGATETVVLTIGGVETNDVQRTVYVHGSLVIDPGTAATAVVVKVRRGTTTAGTEVGSTETQTGAAGNKRVIPFDASDTPGEVSGQSYVVTIVETAATADGTVDSIIGQAIIY